MKLFLPVTSTTCLVIAAPKKKKGVVGKSQVDRDSGELIEDVQTLIGKKLSSTIVANTNWPA